MLHGARCGPATPSGYPAGGAAEAKNHRRAGPVRGDGVPGSPGEAAGEDGPSAVRAASRRLLFQWPVAPPRPSRPAPRLRAACGISSPQTPVPLSPAPCRLDRRGRAGWPRLAGGHPRQSAVLAGPPPRRLRRQARRTGLSDPPDVPQQLDFRLAASCGEMSQPTAARPQVPLPCPTRTPSKRPATRSTGCFAHRAGWCSRKATSTSMPVPARPSANTRPTADPPTTSCSSTATPSA
jgi:hypothetical protein